MLDENRNLSAYEKIFLIAPSQDPRQTVSKIHNEFTSYDFPTLIIDKDSKYKSSQGTAFFISNQGHLLTALHVMENADYATVWFDGGRHYADVVSSSTALDLALLKLREKPLATVPTLSFSGDKTLLMGEKVYTIGYPLSSMLGSQPRLSEGFVSATVGLKDDPNYVQVAAAIQPGNSGGPLMNSKGQILGIIQQSLNSERVMRESGAIPQNVNFALKQDKVLEFFKSTETPNVPIVIAPNRSISLSTAQKSIVKIQPGEVPPDDELNKILVVTIGYLATWDLYKKFIGFELSFYDYQTRDLLFTSGQYNNVMTFNSEGHTISQTVKKALEKIKGSTLKKNVSKSQK